MHDYGLSNRLTLTVIENGENKDFQLVGDISTLPAHPDGLLVSVSGVEVEPGTIDVKHVEEIQLIAELDKSLTDPSQWIRKTDKAYGLSFAVPKEASFNDENSLTPNDLAPNSIDIFNISFPVYPEGPADDGQLKIYVSTGVSEKETYPAGQKFQWINGFKYTECVDEGEIRYEVCSVFTFQNHVSYRFEFWFHIGQPGMVSWGCLYQIINEQQERSFIRLFLSQVAFPRPEIPAADGPNIASPPPEVVRFDKTPMELHERKSPSLDYWTAVLSWKARDADYVQLSFNCARGVAIETNDQDLCYSATPEDKSFNRSPESSQNLKVFPDRQSGPTTVRITLTPFAHGVGFPQSSKTLSLDVPRPEPHSAP